VFILVLVFRKIKTSVQTNFQKNGNISTIWCKQMPEIFGSIIQLLILCKWS